ncbi:hypothetical protein [Acetonema longum]|uniref:Uncharacterized protein n=1 Tax=Acetonema longum DSM 6540 TaxID=1009370 RepID=F7NFE7_9FIRM|nr:hypothetical protein [Acetonema longum]EGO65272.1 hypothetical protein ALO_03871 [Acetonema longum DSM 6540]
MLIIKAEIIFDIPNKNYTENDGITTQYPLRPAFNFGEGLLFSGTIKNDLSCDKLFYQKVYCVNVEFPTIASEAYEAVQPLIKIGMSLKIQNASNVIGVAKLLDFVYRD